MNDHGFHSILLILPLFQNKSTLLGWAVSVQYFGPQWNSSTIIRLISVTFSSDLIILGSKYIWSAISRSESFINLWNILTFNMGWHTWTQQYSVLYPSSDPETDMMIISISSSWSLQQLFTVNTSQIHFIEVLKLIIQPIMTEESSMLSLALPEGCVLLSSCRMWFWAGVSLSCRPGPEGQRPPASEVRDGG